MSDIATKERNKFWRLKLRIASIEKDVYFLKKCEQETILPSFIKIRTSIQNERAMKAVKYAGRFWLKAEIRHHYKQLNILRVVTYELHLKLQ